MIFSESDISLSWVLLTSMIEVKGGDSSGMSETDETSHRRRATVMAQRSPRGKRPPETEINSGHILLDVPYDLLNN
jgi:hypothetical protein